MEILHQLEREENRIKKRKTLPITKITRALCNLPTLVIHVELAFTALLNIPHPAPEMITPFLGSSKVMGPRKASVKLARFSINVSIKSGKSEDSVHSALGLPVC